ncbi:hypothetical protein BDV96DRAFT_649336 [Lophiotrema nucula]|uniref:Uncharacterized protein n=1 Tax=Lophiotrema nucula TaxID=690887 RepID=A0A6A5YXZ9_9PLEO|nr:hypothetical protein BDV96DRAFT_649336 [Lophiotrema nucula]
MLGTYSTELAAAIESLAAHAQDKTSNPFVEAEASDEIRQAQGSILSSVAKIKALVCGPQDLLRHLASQNELLACLRWLGEHQVLACIPLTGTASTRDVAELSAVPETQLRRVVRLMATASFLQEPQPGSIAHTPLSACFVRDPSLLDAALFLAGAAAPTALQMAGGLADVMPFRSVRDGQPKMRRQWRAYLRHASGLLPPEEVAQVLAQLHWSHIDTGEGSTSVVEVGAESVHDCIVQKLSAQYPALRCLVQIHRTKALFGLHPPDLPGATPPGRITITHRAPGSPQPIANAAVYILHLPSEDGAVVGELKVHLEPLRIGNGLLLVLTSRLLPAHGSCVDPDVEADVRSRDLTLSQLLDEGEMDMADLLDQISSVQDGDGRLVVAKQLRSRNGLVVALVVTYQRHSPA